MDDKTTFILEDWWWEGRDFHMLDKDGTERVLTNAYWHSIRFDGLDMPSDEQITMVGNNKVWGSGDNL